MDMTERVLQEELDCWRALRPTEPDGRTKETLIKPKQTPSAAEAARNFEKFLRTAWKAVPFKAVLNQSFPKHQGHSTKGSKVGCMMMRFKQEDWHGR